MSYERKFYHFLLLLFVFSFCPLKQFIRCPIILAPNLLNLDGQDKFLLISDPHGYLQGIDAVNFTLSFTLSFKNNIYNTIIYFKEPFAEWILPFSYHPPRSSLKLDSIYLKAVFLSSIHQQPKKVIVKEFFIADKWGLGYFQTNKPIYRSSETVRFRLLRLNKTFSPISDRCDLIIKNHQNIKIDVVNLTSTAPLYFADYSFPLPLIAKAGKWSAQLLCDNKFSETLTFQVQDYVAPLFKIHIETPRIHLCSSKKIHLKLNVTYTYGKSVNGYVFFKFGVSSIQRPYELKQTTQVFCLEHGILEQNISVMDICSGLHIPTNLIIEAIVTDLATNTKDQAKMDSIIMANSPFQVSTRFTANYYKPKVANYIAFEIVGYDNVPIANVPLKIKMTDRNAHNLRPYVLTSTTNDFNNDYIMLKSDSNGMVIFTFKLNQNYGPLTVHISSNDSRYLQSEQMEFNHKLYPFDYSDSGKNSVIMISNKKKILYQANEYFRSSIVYHGPINPYRIYLVIMNQDHILQWQQIHSETIEFKLTNQMAPGIRLLVLALDSETNKLVADFFYILVKQNNCGVDVRLDPSNGIIQPGGNLTLKFQGTTNDIVSLNAVDEAIRILMDKKNSNEKEKLIYQKIFRNSDSLFPYLNSKDSTSLIKNFGFHIFSLNDDEKSPKQPMFRGKRNFEADCHKYLDEPCCQLACSKFKRPLTCEKKFQILRNHINNERCTKIFLICCQCSMTSKKFTKMSIRRILLLNQPRSLIDSSPIAMASDFDSLDDDNIEARMDFRDSWLFDLVHLNQSVETIFFKVPDSITSWFISTTSISQKDGFCINNNQQITVYKPFFVKVLLSQYIVQYEQTEISATIYNYQPKQIDAYIYFYHIDGICSDASHSLDKVRLRINIGANSSQTIVFPIIPIQIGHFLIRIKALSEQWSDYVVKNLSVIPPGITQEHSLSLDLDPTNRAKREMFTRSIDEINNEIINQIYPDKLYQNIEILMNKHNENIVPGTIRHRLTFIGQRFQPILKSPEQLAHLIKRPLKGCGEQSAFYLAFNLYTLKYLSQIGRLNQTTKNRGMKYLKRSLQELMIYHKEDGSFSTFVDRKSSLWLTSFVLKIFCQSGEFLKYNLDENVLQDSLYWIISRQNEDGTWTELNPLYHRHADGGSNQNCITLTAYILITLNECHSYFQKFYNQTYINGNNSRRKAEIFIQSQLNKEKDSYTLAIMIYSLLLSEYYPTQIDISSSITDLLSHSDLRIDDKMNHLYYNHTSLSVETTSYALLCLNRLQDGNIIERTMLSNWLSSRPLYGSFKNTQDTLLTLEALSDYHQLLSSNEGSNYRLFANVSFDQRPKRFIEFQGNNIDLLHTIDVDHDISNIKIETIGNGFGRFELLTIYNVLNPSPADQCYFDLEVDLLKAESIHYLDNEQFDDSIFFDEDFQKEMLIEELPTSVINQNIKKVCRSKVKRIKRAPIQDNDNDDDLCQNELNNSPLPNLPNVENPLVKIIKICTKRLNHPNNVDESGMIILEISIISGYKVINEDLQLLRNRSIVEWYEVAGSKVTLYLSNVPTDYHMCLCFRIYQEHVVEYIQSALVQIYNYFKKDSNCIRLYTDIGVQRYLNYTCYNEACRCFINKKCPQNEILNRIESLYRIHMIKSFQLFKKVFCTYPIVLMATVSLDDFQNTTYINKDIIGSDRNQIFIANSYEFIRGDYNGTLSSLKLQLHPVCQYLSKIEENRTVSFRAMIMMDSMNNHSSNPIIPLDGQTIFHLITEHNQNVFDDFIEMVRYEAKVINDMFIWIFVAISFFIIFYFIMGNKFPSENNQNKIPIQPNIFGELPEPEPISKIQPILTLYTQNEQNNYLEIKHHQKPEEIISSIHEFGCFADQNQQFSLVVITHGFRSNKQSRWLHDAKDAILEIHSNIAFNEAPQPVVAILGWGGGADIGLFNYPQAAANCLQTGRWLGSVIQKIRSKFSIAKVHGIGHSLGAHLMGMAGRCSERSFDRITGLDPAGPAFQTENIDKRLNRNDAELVDVIHTDGQNAPYFGTLVPLGKIDFYPNYGWDQPSNDGKYNAKPMIEFDNKNHRKVEIPSKYDGFISESHGRAIDFFVWSILNPGQFRTHLKLNENPDVEKGVHRVVATPLELGIQVEMGYHLDSFLDRISIQKFSKISENETNDVNQRYQKYWGNYYVHTNGQAPWC